MAQTEFRRHFIPCSYGTNSKLTQQTLHAFRLQYKNYSNYSAQDRSQIMTYERRVYELHFASDGLNDISAAKIWHSLLADLQLHLQSMQTFGHRQTLFVWMPWVHLRIFNSHYINELIIIIIIICLALFLKFSRLTYSHKNIAAK